jgi:tetratricopeptide (TPR) repeat protein
MPSEIKELNTTQPPALAYAQLLIDMHRLIVEGKGDSEEAEALAERMDAPWHAMTGQEQARMRGLAADLNALREGGPARVDMTPEQLATWRAAARETFNQGEIEDVDAALNFLRRPAPSGPPRQFTPFLQSRCWEKMGDLETALVFMKEADRLDPDPLSVLLLLQQLGRVDDLPQYANQVIQDPASPPLDLYLAAVALFKPTLRMSDAEAIPILRQAANVLRRALSKYLDPLPEWEEESPDADTDIALALGVALERLGELKSAIDVYTEAIKRQPRGGELYVARGLALYETNQAMALADFVRAVHLGAAAIWPYLLLARHAIQGGAHGEALRLARMAENQPGPSVARAEVCEIIGMALAELGRPQEEVLQNFDRALALDPNNNRIRENREIATGLFLKSPGERAKRLHLLQPPPIHQENLQGMRSDLIKNRLDLLLNERHHNRVSRRFVEV